MLDYTTKKLKHVIKTTIEPETVLPWSEQDNKDRYKLKSRVKGHKQCRQMGRPKTRDQGTQCWLEVVSSDCLNQYLPLRHRDKPAQGPPSKSGLGKH